LRVFASNERWFDNEVEGPSLIARYCVVVHPGRVSTPRHENRAVEWDTNLRSGIGTIE